MYNKITINKMKNIKIILESAIMVFVLASCSKNDEQTNDFKQIVKEKEVVNTMNLLEHTVYFQFNSDVGLEMESKLIIGNDTIIVPCCTAETFADDFVANNVLPHLNRYTYINLSDATVAKIKIYTNSAMITTNYITHVVN